METRVAVMGIIVEDKDAVNLLNEISGICFPFCAAALSTYFYISVICFFLSVHDFFVHWLEI